VLLAREFEPAARDAQRVPEVVADDARELLQELVLAFELALAALLIGDVGVDRVALDVALANLDRDDVYQLSFAR